MNRSEVSSETYRRRANRCQKVLRGLSNILTVSGVVMVTDLSMICASELGVSLPLDETIVAETFVGSLTLLSVAVMGFGRAEVYRKHLRDKGLLAECRDIFDRPEMQNLALYYPGASPENQE